jgi:hypothetical protein
MGEREEYTDPDGTTWDSYEEYVTIGLCGLCDCGRESIKSDIITLLRDIENLWDDFPDTEYHELILHLLNDKGLMEHGTSVSGSFLSEQGHAIRSELRRARGV